MWILQILEFFSGKYLTRKLHFLFILVTKHYHLLFFQSSGHYWNQIEIKSLSLRIVHFPVFLDWNCLTSGHNLFITVKSFLLCHTTNQKNSELISPWSTNLVQGWPEVWPLCWRWRSRIHPITDEYINTSTNEKSLHCA